MGIRGEFASDYGLKPGKWPGILTTPDGKTWQFQREVAFSGELLYVLYLSTGNGGLLRLYND